MENHLTIIIDADAIIAMVNPNDFHTKKVMDLLEKLFVEEAYILIPTTAIAEATTTLQRKLNNPLLTKNIITLTKNSNLVIKSVGEEILNNAYNLFDPTKSKHNTLFDAIIASSAKYYGADAIFSFDSWYKKIGLRLVEDIV